MERVPRLPPLPERYGISANNSGDTDENINVANITHRRRPELYTVDSVTDALPIDCVLVYSEHDEEQNHDNEQEHRETMTLSTRRNKFEHYLKETEGKTEYVLVHTPFPVLLRVAEDMQMKLRIEKIENQQPKSYWRRFNTWWKKTFLLHSELAPEDLGYYTAVCSSETARFKHFFGGLSDREKNSYFTAAERSLLTYELLSRSHANDFNDDHEEDEPIQNAPTKIPEGTIPLSNIAGKLRKDWATLCQCFKFQPLNLVRSYIGEKLAFYFAFIGFYNQMLIPAAFVGLLIFIYGAASAPADHATIDICGSFGDSTYMCPTCNQICPFRKLSDSCVYSTVSRVFDNAVTVVFAVLMSLWARWFIELWKRRQSVLRYDWDSTDFEGNLEPTRPEYETEIEKHRKKYLKKYNPLTKEYETVIQMKKRLPFYLVAILVVLITVAIVCTALFSIIVYRVKMNYILKETSVQAYASIIITITSAIMNLICTLGLSVLYYRLAKKITDLEHHNFQSTYDGSLTIKIYIFQFANYYSSFFYIAFFKGRFNTYPSQYGSQSFDEPCDPGGCLLELSIQLLIFMIGNQIVNIIAQLVWVMRDISACACCGGSSNKNAQKQWEIDKNLDDIDSITLIDEYITLAIQFGFVTLFAVAFPLAPLFALLNNLIELRLDAWKFLLKYRRPIPYKASGIGIWNDIISGVSYLAVLTNGVIIAWTSQFVTEVAYRSIQSTGTSLGGYVNWTLAYFPISDYNQTVIWIFVIQLVHPYYSERIVYWNVLAARLAFIIVFEHIIYVIVYSIQWLTPDVPKKIQCKIIHERVFDQRERWTSMNNARTERRKST
ncbi:unnamed protein product [Rotaria magnacalcarata]